MIKITINRKSIFRFIRAIAYLISTIALCKSDLTFETVQSLTITLIAGIIIEFIIMHNDEDNDTQEDIERETFAYIATVGRLMIDKIILENDDGKQLFIGINKKNDLYLCYKIENTQNWLIVDTDVNELMTMLLGRIDIRKALTSKEEIYHLEQEREGKYTCYLKGINLINKNVFPEEGKRVKIARDEVMEYIKEKDKKRAQK